MKSILRQLKKYQPKTEEGAAPKDKPKALIQADLSDSVTTIAENLGISPLALNKVPHFSHVNVLYPFKLLCIYDLVTTGRAYIPDAESKCDELILAFMDRKTSDIAGYVKIFKKAMSDRVQHLIAARILVATFQMGNTRMDFLPAAVRARVCSLLNTHESISKSQAMSLLEQAQKWSNLEEQILGRLGYMMMWRSLTGKGPALPAAVAGLLE